MSSAQVGLESQPPNAQGFRREVRPRRVSRHLRRGHNGVVDGRAVNIPLFVLNRFKLGVDQTGCLMPCAKMQGVSSKIESVGKSANLFN